MDRSAVRRKRGDAKAGLLRIGGLVGCGSSTCRCCGLNRSGFERVQRFPNRAEILADILNVATSSLENA